MHDESEPKKRPPSALTERGREKQFEEELQAPTVCDHELMSTSDRGLRAAGMGSLVETARLPEGPLLKGAGSAQKQGLGVFSIDAIRAHNPAGALVLNGLQKPDFSIEIHPSGIISRAIHPRPIKPPETHERGQIEGFSDKAARRLREVAMTQDVPECFPVSVTLTTHRFIEPEEWREIIKRFRQRLIREGWAGIWRVELQRRQTPHLHVVLWLPKWILDDWFNQVRDAWLDASRESGDQDARKFAVMGRRLENSGWLVYMALHDSKHKREQLGWKGKQWGIWNREKFQDREAICRLDLTEEMHRVMIRFMNRWARAQTRVRIRYLNTLKPRNAKEAEDQADKIRSAKRSLKRRLSSGPFLRCLDGLQMKRLVELMASSRLSSREKANDAACMKPLAGPEDIVSSGGTLLVGGQVHCTFPESRLSPLHFV